jgi:hypothetical protein
MKGALAMADRIEKLTGETARDITEAWVATYPNQIDNARNLETLRFYLFENPKIHWYHGVTDDSYFFLSGVVPGHQAIVNFISKRGAPALQDWRSVLRMLADIMDEHKLIKLLWMVPGHARRLYDAVKKVKFDIEGWLKSGCLINGKPTDLAALGLFRDDVELHLGHKPASEVLEHNSKPRKKRRGRRRPNQRVSSTNKARKNQGA